jgi:hypothetical protein
MFHFRYAQTPPKNIQKKQLKRKTKHHKNKTLKEAAKEKKGSPKEQPST